MNLWRPLLIRLLIFIVPLFFIWKLVSETVVIPALSQVTSYWIGSQYQAISAKLVYNENEQRWSIKTKLLEVNNDQDNSHEKIKPKETDFIVISIDHLLGYTQGLLVFWLFVLVISKQRLKQLLLGSFTQFVLIMLLMWLILHYRITVAMDTEILLRVLTQDGLVIKVNSPSIWSLSMMKPFIDALSYAVLYISPLLMGYWFNSSELHAMNTSSQT